MSAHSSIVLGSIAFAITDKVRSAYIAFWITLIEFRAVTIVKIAITRIVQASVAKSITDKGRKYSKAF